MYSKLSYHRINGLKTGLWLLWFLKLVTKYIESHSVSLGYLCYYRSLLFYICTSQGTPGSTCSFYTTCEIGQQAPAPYADQKAV